MSCIPNELCKRLQCLSTITNTCQHIGALHFNIIQVIGFLIFPIAVGLATASNFGTASVQIFMLILYFNYGRKSATSLASPMSTGIFLSSVVVNLGKKHPKLNIPLIDYDLALILLPNMITGLIAGIHFKYQLFDEYLSRDFVPPLIVTFFFVFQLLILIKTTQNKLKQFQQLQKLENSVQSECKDKQDIISSSCITLDDGVFFDLENIFKLIAQSPKKDIYLKYFPEELRNLDLQVDENKVRVGDYIAKKFDATQVKQVEEKLEEEKVNAGQINYSTLIAIGVIVIINLGLLIAIGRDKNSQEVQGCKGNYWKAFPLQFIINTCLFILISFIFIQKKIITGDLPPTLSMASNWIKVGLLSFFGGFCLGIVGIGMTLFLVVALMKMKISKGGIQSIGATIPLILATVTFKGTIIQIITGALTDVIAAVVIGVLAYIGQFKMNPIIQGEIKKRKLSTSVTKSAIYFQGSLLLLYVASQLPKILKTPLLEQLTPHPYCG